MRRDVLQAFQTQLDTITHASGRGGENRELPDHTEKAKCRSSSWTSSARKRSKTTTE